MYHFFTSIEFYVIACVVAAAIVIISAMPKQGGEARQYLLGGFLCFDNDDSDEDSSPTANGTSDTAQPSTSDTAQPSTSDTAQPSSGEDVNVPTDNRTNIPSNVSISSSYVSATPPPEPTIIEVTENGERTIPTYPTKKGKKQGKGQFRSKPTVSGWFIGAVEAKEPEIDLLCMDNGTVKLIRRGLNGLVTADGAVSIACTLIGFDLRIEERLTYGGRNLKDPAPTEAVFSLEFLAPNEHYHIHYNSETIHRMAAFTLATKEGMHVVKTLS